MGCQVAIWRKNLQTNFFISAKLPDSQNGNERQKTNLVCVARKPTKWLPEKYIYQGRKKPSVCKLQIANCLAKIENIIEKMYKALVAHLQNPLFTTLWTQFTRHTFYCKKAYKKFENPFWEDWILSMAYGILGGILNLKKQLGKLWQLQRSFFLWNFE